MEVPTHLEKPKPAMIDMFGAMKVSFSIVIISLPLLYVSFLHMSPHSLLKDNKFWFLLSNTIIILVAVDSGMFSSSSEKRTDIYDEYMKHNKSSWRGPEVVEGKEGENISQDEKVEDKNMIVLEKGIVVANGGGEKKEKFWRSKSEIAKRNRVEGKELGSYRSMTLPSAKERRRREGVVVEDEISEYSKMSNEELNRRVEEFIRRFNREIRLEKMRT